MNSDLPAQGLRSSLQSSHKRGDPVVGLDISRDREFTVGFSLPISSLSSPKPNVFCCTPQISLVVVPESVL